MTSRDTGTEADIATLVYGFYDRVRDDAMLGPIFQTHVDNWDDHLPKMVSFWSSLLLGAGTYRGSPMTTHAALPGLRAELFSRWLTLFKQTTAEMPDRLLADRADEYADRIARSLWYGYQLTSEPDQRPTEIATHG